MYAIIGFIVIVVFVASGFAAPTSIGLLINPHSSNAIGLPIIFVGSIAVFCVLAISLPSAFVELIRDKSERSIFKFMLVATGSVIGLFFGIGFSTMLVSTLR